MWPSPAIHVVIDLMAGTAPKRSLRSRLLIANMVSDFFTKAAPSDGFFYINHAKTIAYQTGTNLAAKWVRRWAVSRSLSGRLFRSIETTIITKEQGDDEQV